MKHLTLLRLALWACIFAVPATHVLTACPTTVLTTASANADICSGATIDLTTEEANVTTDDDPNVVLSWEDAGGNVVAFPNNVSLTHSGLSCDPEIYVFNVIVDCTTDPNLDLAGGTYTITVYPDVSAEFLLPATDCLVGITDNCASGALIIQYSIDGGITFNPAPPTDLNAGDPDLIVDYLISTSGMPPACEVSGQYVETCPAPCPTTILIAVDDSTDICGSQTVDLTLAEASLSTDSDSEVVASWEDAGGNAVAFPNNVSLSHSGAGCAPEVHVFHLIVDCTSDTNLDLAGGTYTVTVYPDLSSGAYLLPSADCQVQIMDICSSGSIDIQYSIDGGTTYSTSPPPDLSPGDPSLTIDYIISTTNLPAGCEEIGQYMVTCPPVCPTTVLTSVNAGTSICASGTIDLTSVEFLLTTDLDSEVVLTWLDNLGNPIALPSNVPLNHSGGSCEPDTMEFHLEVDCTTDPGLDFDGGTYSVIIFPDISSSFSLPANLCQVSISDDCTNGALDIQYSTDGGTTFSATPPTDLIPGDPDLTIDYNISVAGAPLGCEEVGQYVVTCPSSCPTAVLTPISGSEDICVSGTIDLSVQEAMLSTDFDVAAVISWEDGNGNLLADPTAVNVNHSGTTCDPETFTFFAVVDCFTDATLDLAGGSYSITVYPDVSAGAYTLPGTCLGTIIDNCTSGSLDIQYSIDGGISFGPTPPPDLNPGNSDWTIHFIISTPGAPAGCETTGQYTMTCPFGCFSTVFTTASGSSDVCESGTVDMTVIEAQVTTDFDPSVGFIWVDSNANGVPNPDNMSFNHSGTSCDPETYSFGLVAYCLLDININSFVGTYDITVYPDLSPYVTLPFVDCQVAITDNCATNAMDILYSTDGGNTFSFLTPFPLQPGDPDLTVHYSVSLSGSGGACPATGQYTVECPLGCLNTVLNTGTGNTIVCSGDMVDLTVVESQISTDLDASAVFVWEDAVGNPISNPATHAVTHSGTSCNPETYNFLVYVDCLTDSTLDLFGGNYLVTVYPDISNAFSLPTDSCQTEISDDCTFGSLDILYSTDGGINYSSTAPASLNPGDPDLTIDYLVNTAGGPTSCTVSGQYVVECPLVCPTMVTTQVSANAEFCESGVVDLTSIENQLVTNVPPGELLFWQDQNGFFVVDPSNVTVQHSGNSCDPETYTFHLVVSCTIDNMVSLDGGMYAVTVYPEIEASMYNIPSVCITQITDNCSSGSIDVQYSADGGVTYTTTPPSALNQGDPDLTIDYILSISGQPAACDLSGQYTVSCPFQCFNTVLNPVSAELYLCSGDVFDLTTLEGQLMTDAPGTEILIWTDSNGNTVADPTTITPTNTIDCFPIDYVYDLTIECVNDGSIQLAAGSVTLWAFPDNIDDYYVVSGENTCQTMIDIDVACQSIISVDVNQQTASIGTNGLHAYQFTYPEVGGLDCGLDITVQVPYDCPVICPTNPSASANQLHICSGDTIVLLASVSGGNTTNISYTWVGDNGVGAVTDPNLVQLFNTDCAPLVYTFTVTAICDDTGATIAPEGNESVNVTVYPSSIGGFVSGFGDGDCTTGVNIQAGCEPYIDVSPALSQTGATNTTGTHNYLVEYNDGGLNLDCAFDINLSLNYDCLEPCPEINLIDPNEPLCSDFGSINLNILILPDTDPGSWAITAFPAGANPLFINGTDLVSNDADAGIYELTYTLDTAPIDFCPDSAVITIEVVPLPLAAFTYTVDGNTVTFTNLSTNANNYLWDFADGSSSADFEPVYTFADQGIFEVSLTASDGLCTPNTIFEEITIGNGVGIDEIDSGEISIYPNPNDGQFYITSDIGSAVNYRILDMTGRQVISDVLPASSQHYIDITSPPAGIYFIEIDSGENTFIKKVVIE